MSHKNKESIVKICTDSLIKQTAFGESKHFEKFGFCGSVLTDGKIYSLQTLKNYMKTVCLFIREMKKQGFKLKTLDDVRHLAPIWLEQLISNGYSAFTIKTYAAALAKVLHFTINDFGIEFPQRTRSAITRSRKTLFVTKTLMKLARRNIKI